MAKPKNDAGSIVAGDTTVSLAPVDEPAEAAPAEPMDAEEVERINALTDHTYDSGPAPSAVSLPDGTPVDLGPLVAPVDAGEPPPEG